MTKKHRLVRTEDWMQLELRFTWTEQRRYETIRPVVLFGKSAEERALETGEPIRTIYRNLQRFTTKGMTGLLEPDQPPKSRALPQAVRELIIELKAEHPGLRFNEIARICAVRLNYHPSPHTVKRIVKESPPLLLKSRRFPRFHEMEDDPAKRRAIIVRLFFEGWTQASIAAYLETSRKTVRLTLARWKEEGVITSIDNYSRAILSSAVTRAQDLTAYLCVLCAAIGNHGAPQGIVSDGGGVFKAKKVLEIYKALGSERHQIDKGQAWQNYLETQFNLMRIMADHDIENATTWEELVEAHARWCADFNFQNHSAHTDREDGRHSPFQVLAWQRGVIYSEDGLRHLFYTTRFVRKLNRVGYLRFRNWKIYAEEGLPREEAALFLSEEHMTVAFEDEPLAHYSVTYQPDQKNLRTSENAPLTPSRQRWPQLRLLDMDEDGWRIVYRVTKQPGRKKKPEPPIAQLGLELDAAS